MMSFKANQKQSPYIAKELEKIQSKLKPFMKKKYYIYLYIDATYHIFDDAFGHHLVSNWD